MMLAPLVALLLGAPPSPAPLVAAPLDSDAEVVTALAAYYTKHEVDIPMRDGVRLHTDYWLPKVAGPDDARTWPLLMVRTPYGIPPYGVDRLPDPKNRRALTRFAPSRELIRSGYVFVHQDVRGRLMSEGSFVDVRPRDAKSTDESSDTYDSIAWLVKNVPRNSGKVGVWGISYPGFYAAQAAIDAHPALVAVSPMAPVTEWFIGDDFHHNGALCLADAVDFFANFGRVRAEPTRAMPWDFVHDVADLYDFFLALGPLGNVNARYLHGSIPFWNDLMAHPSRDAWWQARDPRPHYKDIRPAVLVVGGWFDAEDLWGALATYAAMNTQTAKNRVSLVMGPWSHGGWHRTDGDVLGDIPFGQKTSEAYVRDLETPFFESHLKGDGRVKTPEATVFITGSNTWRSFATWPPATTATAMYVGARGALSVVAPSEAEASDAFVSDPAHPVPYMDGTSGEIEKRFMTADQRFAAHRPDVLSYTSVVLTADVTIAGPIEADVWLTTTGSDADVIVKLIDIWPEDMGDAETSPESAGRAGYQQLVRGEVFRGRFRSGFATPTPMVPGEPSEVRFTLPDMAHTFRVGHRIGVQIQSSWFPFIDRNPQTFVDIATADASAYRAQTHQVLRSTKRATSVRLPILEGRLP